MQRPLIIAGPCLAESYDMLCRSADCLVTLASQLDFSLLFKASFDKANRSASASYRGEGLAQFCQWLSKLKKEFALKVITDVHETQQIETVVEVCDALQIPAFLCRQTDLVTKAVASGLAVNIKKGQFMSPWGMNLIATDIKNSAPPLSLENYMLTERGYSFGYGRLVVDMSALQIMATSGLPVIYDVTHSVQCSPAAPTAKTSRGDRYLAPALARAATATGYLSGFFLEVHPDPPSAHSDRDLQLSLPQAELLIPQLLHLWQETQGMTAIDEFFIAVEE